MEQKKSGLGGYSDQKAAVDGSVPSDTNIRETESEKLEKYRGLKEEPEKSTVVSVVVGAAGNKLRYLTKPSQGSG